MDATVPPSSPGRWRALPLGIALVALTIPTLGAESTTAQLAMLGGLLLAVALTYAIAMASAGWFAAISMGMLTWQLPRWMPGPSLDESQSLLWLTGMATQLAWMLTCFSLRMPRLSLLWSIGWLIGIVGTSGLLVVARHEFHEAELPWLNHQWLTIHTLLLLIGPIAGAALAVPNATSTLRRCFLALTPGIGWLAWMGWLTGEVRLSWPEPVDAPRMLWGRLTELSSLPNLMLLGLMGLAIGRAVLRGRRQRFPNGLERQSEREFPLGWAILTLMVTQLALIAAPIGERSGLLHQQALIILAWVPIWGVSDLVWAVAQQMVLPPPENGGRVF
ncbi:hypothetical protein [Tuwongella immobilis]|uniref:Uncharacterized protein n=1 Tax=Tuwongella immobilis TaxID=692036 RepID=A0A6C2YJB1_9BACT|nr:hypothetical protein [Tuwongella immobilis]VIP01496.1 unnamed protein product [Tuwongella immobilis]VTR98580.1 unnamed protein product [Tuwongella immobilis]